jgi:plasmid stabilization system protein ParE
VTTVRLRPQAEADLVERARFYNQAAGDEVAGRFFDNAISALTQIGEFPHSGSLHVAALSGIDGLRAVRIAGFPCAWFYLVRADRVDVVRLLADSQDLPAQLNDPEVR